MDLIIKQSSSTRWDLIDLLGRNAGHVELALSGCFRIIPSGRAVGTMATLSPGPYSSLDAALAAIETHTRGVCRREPEERGQQTPIGPGNEDT